MRERRLILDTCALLWLAGGDARLSREARHAIDGASLVLVSAISAWEVSLKVARGQLELRLPAADWFDAVLRHHKLLLASLDVAVLTAANELPWHHRDPADRFIIATALREDAAVVTADGRFAAYGIRVIY